jgi:hypothetical protein
MVGRRLLAFVVFAFAMSVSTRQASSPPTYTLKPTPKTIAWGYYDAITPPVLRIKSGETVESSVAADLSITELVDGNKGVHMSIPKSIFASGGAK